MDEPTLHGMVESNPRKLGGEACFGRSRVPVRSLFDHIEEGFTLDEFLSQFPSVTREQAVAVLQHLGA